MPDDNLSRLLLTDTGQPFYKSLFQSLKELIHPPQLPPLKLTSQPVDVKDIWGLYGRQKKSFMLSTGVQSAAVLLSSPRLPRRPCRSTATGCPAHPPGGCPYSQASGAAGGGGGGDRSPLPASKGKLPKPAVRQFVPPSAVVNNPQPKLVMDASILAPPDDVMTNVNLPNYGDPLGKLGPPSNGTGSGGGIGSGRAAA